MAVSMKLVLATLILTFSTPQILACRVKCDPSASVQGAICDLVTANCTCQCIGIVVGKGSGCWTSSQCRYPGSYCLTANDDRLDYIDESVWSEARETESGDRVPAPGICNCGPRYYHDAENGACFLRSHESVCKVNADCFPKLAFSTCINKRCKCAHGYEYDPIVDICVQEEVHEDFHGTCFGNTCVTTGQLTLQAFVFCSVILIMISCCVSCCIDCCCKAKTGKEKTDDDDDDDMIFSESNRLKKEDINSLFSDKFKDYNFKI